MKLSVERPKPAPRRPGMRGGAGSGWRATPQRARARPRAEAVIADSGVAKRSRRATAESILTPLSMATRVITTVGSKRPPESRRPGPLSPLLMDQRAALARVLRVVPHSARSTRRPRRPRGVDDADA